VPKLAQSVIGHCNIGINEDLFETSFASWRDAWLLDTSATCQMIFRRELFEELNDNVDGAVNFTDGSSLKPTRIGTIMLKFLGFPYFILHNVLYLPKLQRKLLSLVHIRQQGHSIHMFYGPVEIRRSSNNMVIKTRWEDEKLVKLKGTFAQAQDSTYLSHHDEGTFSYSLLWDARFGHINYDEIHLLNKNGVSGFPTIPRNLKHCEACILGKHNKQHFHDSSPRACRKL
jgi:hypothetical protein